MTLSPARAAILARVGRKPACAKNVPEVPSIPEVSVPGIGVAQAILPYWFKVERRFWDIAGGSMQLLVSVTYFRLWIPATKKFWFYRPGTKNVVPRDAVIIYG